MSGWQYSLNWSTDPIQSLSESHWILSRNWQSDLNTHIEIQGAQDSQNTLEKRGTNLEDPHLPISKLIESYSNETLCYWRNDGQLDQWDRSEGQKQCFTFRGQLISDKDDKTIKWGKKTLFNKGFWDNWILTCKRIKLDPYLTSYSKINLKWVKGLNERVKTIKQKNRDKSSWPWIKHKHQQPQR